MASSLYRLAGKPHPVESPNSQASNAPEVPTPEVVESVSSSVEVTASVVDEAVEAQQSDAAQDTTPEVVVQDDPVVPEYPVWDSSWTKTKLLGIALDLGLSVTADSTKSEIVAALTAATLS